MKKKLFPDQVALVTGASSGIGAAVALELAQQGANVALCARREEKLREQQIRIQNCGGTCEIFVCDVCSFTSVEKMVDAIIQRFGRIDIVVANAGFGVTGIFEKLTVEDFRRQFETNFFGVLHTLYAVLPYIKATQGRVGIVSSLMGKIGLPTGAAYSSSKFALCGLADCMYYELHPFGVSVTNIVPGLVESDIRRTDNYGQVHPEFPDPAPSWLIMPAEKAAKQIVWGLFKRKPEIVITRHAKFALLLSRHFPRAWRFLLREATANRVDKVQQRRRGKINPQ